MKNLYGKFEQIKLRARQLRSPGTPEERMLWNILRNRRFWGRKFYRQYSIAFDDCGRARFFIADFYCHDARLVIELDGSVHQAQKDHDETRTALLKSMGLRVLRIENDAMADLEAVKLKIADAIDDDETISAVNPVPLSSQERGDWG